MLKDPHFASKVRLAGNGKNCYTGQNRDKCKIKKGGGDGSVWPLGRLKPLSAAEEQVLLAVWSCKPPASRRDIGERLAEKGWKPATVLNFLYRLEAKGWVKSGKDQNRNIYTPTITKRAYSVWIMRERLDAVFGGDVAAAVRALVSESGCSQSQLEQAIAVLEEKHAEAEEYDLYDPYG